MACLLKYYCQLSLQDLTTCASLHTPKEGEKEEVNDILVVFK